MHHCPVRITDDPADDSTSEGHGPTNKAHSDHFRMYTYKVRRCTRMKKHDWTLCPYSHHGEKAARRDPRRVPYLGVPCPDSSVEGSGCPRGDRCAFAHGVFEYWLHPSRYRTRPCNAGPYCKRRVCFFAHAPEELRPEPNFQFRHYSPPFQEDRVAFAPVVVVGKEPAVRRGNVEPVEARGSSFGSPSLEATLLESFRRMGLVRGSEQLSCVSAEGQNDVVWWDMLDQELGNLGWSASEAPG